MSQLGIGQEVILYGIVVNAKDEPIEDVLILIESEDKLVTSDRGGEFSFSLKPQVSYTLFLTNMSITPYEKNVFLRGDTSLVFRVEQIGEQLQEVVIEDQPDVFGIRRLRAVESGGIYEGKKTEVINVEQLIANKAGNNAR